MRFGAIAEWRVQLGDRIVVTHEDGQCRSGRSQEVEQLANAQEAA